MTATRVVPEVERLIDEHLSVDCSRAVVLVHDAGCEVPAWLWETAVAVGS